MGGNIRLEWVAALNRNMHVKQTNDEVKETPVDNDVQYVKQDSPVQDNNVVDSSVQDFKQLHFAVTVTHDGKPKRTTVMLEGYLVKALRYRQGLTDNAAIRTWVEQAIKSDDRFESFAPLTRQVKRIIVESLLN
jgi:hypothetical protein